MAAIAIVLLAALIVVVHDQLIIRDLTGKQSALWKGWLFSSHLPARWRFEQSSENRYWGHEEAVVASGSVFQVPYWVERQEADGSWTRRRCTSTLWCEDFDYWHLTRIHIDGEAPIELDEIDGPTGQAGRLWVNQIFDKR